MSTFFHPITIIGPNGQETADALVDTAVMFAVMPAPLLERLGVRPLDRRRYRGSLVGQVEAELGDEHGHVMVVFSGEADQPRIGRHTLDSFILDIDEETGALVPKALQTIEHAY